MNRETIVRQETTDTLARVPTTEKETQETVNSSLSTLEIQNVVATSELGREVDLETVASGLDRAEFTPEEFHRLKYQLESLAAMSLVFRSGKMTCTDARSVEKVDEAITKTINALQGLGIRVNSQDVTIQNIVSSANIGERLNLNAIAIGFGLKEVEYEPEQFPGLVSRPQESSIVVLLFETEKTVITGARTHGGVEDGLKRVITRLEDLSLLG